MPQKLTLRQRYAAILEWFSANRPAVQSELHNMVTPALFKRFPDPESLAGAAFDDLLSIIRSVSYPNSKARHLIDMARKLVSDFHSVIPSDIDSLMSLPGVGRKTANVVASILYDKPVIAVDTHVLRVSNRLGLSHGKTPEKVEADLESHIPVEQRAMHAIQDAENVR